MDLTGQYHSLYMNPKNVSHKPLLSLLQQIPSKCIPIITLVKEDAMYNGEEHG